MNKFIFFIILLQLKYIAKTNTPSDHYLLFNYIECVYAYDKQEINFAWLKLNEYSRKVNYQKKKTLSDR